MRQLMHTEFAALLARAGITQAAFARLAGITARQVNNWARGRAAVPQWAALLAIALLDLSAEELAIRLEEVPFSWSEVLGLSAAADTATIRRAWTALARRYHPDMGGRPEPMVRVNAAYEEARLTLSGGHPPRH